MNKNIIYFKIFKKKNLDIANEKKIKILFKKFNIKKSTEMILINNFIKIFKNKINLSRIKINYISLIFKKSKIKNLKKNFLKLLIVLKKKQTYVNISLNFLKKIHNTNGIVLKKNGIFEKSRKKDSKTSILNINESVKYLKKFKDQNYLIINIKHIKPFLNKINKILKNEIKKDCKIIITPNIPFYGGIKFKKIKSIKRRLRKKYNIIDI